MLFRIAEMAGEPDWEGLGRAMPEHVFDGWCEHYAREPFGGNHLYDFLADAFCKLAWAFHDATYAAKLERSDFKAWDVRSDLLSEGLSDDDIRMTMERWKSLKRDGSV